jgi:D-3-phosphoglycerate dehydrogenase
VTPHVVLSEDIHPDGRAVLERRARVSVAAGTSEAELCQAVRDADGLVMRANGRVTETVLAAAPRLQVIGRHGVGLDNIDVAAARRRGVQVVHTPHANTGAVAEHAVAGLLTLVRRLREQDAAVRRGDWAARDRLLGTELEGKTLGVLGFGNIGQRVARILGGGFGMSVVYCDPLDRGEAATRLHARRLDLPALLRTADVLTVHVPLVPSTRGLLNAARLAELRPHAVLVNVARGGIVDEAALLAACVEGRLAGAALDVFADEPLPVGHPLTTCDRILLTPHSAAMTEESARRMAMVVEDVLAVIDGRTPDHPAPYDQEGISA